jgi:hypothetical protein
VAVAVAAVVLFPRLRVLAVLAALDIAACILGK